MIKEVAYTRSADKSKEFLKKFGFSSLKDLPEVPEYEEMRREREEEGYGQIAIDFEDKE